MLGVNERETGRRGAQWAAMRLGGAGVGSGAHGRRSSVTVEGLRAVEELREIVCEHAGRRGTSGGTGKVHRWQKIEEGDLLVGTRPQRGGIRVLPRSVKVLLRSTDQTDLSSPALLATRRLPSPWPLQQWEACPQAGFDHQFPVGVDCVTTHSEISKHEDGHGDGNPGVEGAHAEFGQVDDGPPGGGIMDGRPGVREPFDVQVYVEEVDGYGGVE